MDPITIVASCFAAFVYFIFAARGYQGGDYLIMLVLFVVAALIVIPMLGG